MTTRARQELRETMRDRDRTCGFEKQLLFVSDIGDVKNTVIPFLFNYLFIYRLVPNPLIIWF